MEIVVRQGSIGDGRAECIPASCRRAERQGRPWDSCNRRLAYVEFRLHESIVYFGYYSPQANYWRHERHEAFEELERYRRREWREREWREREWREHERREHRRDEDGRRYYRDRDGDRD